MFNKKIIIGLLLCMPKIFGMHKSECLASEKQETKTMHTNTQSTYAPISVYDASISFSDKKNSQDFPNLYGIGLTKCAPIYKSPFSQKLYSQNSSSISTTHDCIINSTHTSSFSQDRRETQAMTVNTNGLQSSSQAKTKDLSFGSNQAKVSIPFTDIVKFAKYASIMLGELIKNYKLPEELIRSGRFINCIMSKYKNSIELQKSIEFKNFRSDLESGEDTTFKREIYEFTTITGSQPYASEHEIQTSISIIETENIWLDTMLKDLYATYYSSKKSEHLALLAKFENKLAYNKAALKVLNGLLEKSNICIAKGGAKTKTSGAMANFIEKLNIISGSRFDIYMDGLSSKDLVCNHRTSRNTHYDDDTKYQSGVKDKIDCQVKIVINGLSKSLYSLLDKLNFDELLEARQLIREQIIYKKKIQSALKNTCKNLYEEYYYGDKQTATAIALGQSEINNSKNEYEIKELEALDAKIDNEVETRKKQEEAGKQTVQTKTKNTSQATTNTTTSIDTSQSSNTSHFTNTSQTANTSQSTNTIQVQANKKDQDVKQKNLQQDSKQTENSNQKTVTITVDEKTSINIPISEVQKNAIQSANLIVQDYITTNQNDTYSEQTETTQFFYDKHEQYQNDRVDAAQKDITNNGLVTFETYIVSDAFSRMLIQAGQDPDVFKSLEGTASQHATQKQIIETGNTIASSNALSKEGKDLAITFVASANDFNKIGNTTNANILVDCCNVLEGIAKGFAIGAINAINPVRFAEGITFLSTQFVKLTAYTTLSAIKRATGSESAQSIPLLGNYLKALNTRTTDVLEAKYAELKDNLTEICSNLKKRCETASAADIAEFTTSVITEIIISGKVQGATGKFLANQVPKIGPTFQRVSRLIRNGLKPEMAERAVFASAEGVEVAIARDFVEAVEASAATENNATNILNQTAQRNTVGNGARQCEVVRRFYRFLDEEAVINAIAKHGEELILSRNSIDKLTREGNFIGNKLTFSEKYWSHIFGQECRVLQNRSGIITMQKSGLHSSQYLKSINFKNPIINENGIISGAVTTQELKLIEASNQYTFVTRLQDKTLFPISWGNEKISDVLIKSFNNIENATNIIISGTKFSVEIFLNDLNIKIKHIFDINGKLITSYPIL